MYRERSAYAAAVTAATVAADVMSAAAVPSRVLRAAAVSATALAAVTARHCAPTRATGQVVADIVLHFLKFEKIFYPIQQLQK